jgi:diguanylate cyclase (GGDEF)-like protein/PAS domain S-box-containing protein
MEAIQHAAMASQWWQALSDESQASASSSQLRNVLAELVEELATGLEAEPFDVGVGERVGGMLAAAGFSGPAAPTASAIPLRSLARASARSDAERRASRLLAAVVRGYRDKGLQLQAPAGENSLARSRTVTEQWFRVALDSAGFAVAIGDIDGTIRYANQAMGDLVGVPIESIDIVSVFDFTHPDDVDEVNSLFLEQTTRRSGTVRMEGRSIRPDGAVRWHSFAVTYVPGWEGQPDTFVAVGEDMTERHRLQEELHWQARHDPLTGLPNRRGLQERIETIAASAGAGDRVGLCLADLDRFKQVNDHYGHRVGDQVLSVVADRLRSGIAGTDHMIARIGGDEFVVLIAPPADDQEVVAVAEALLQSLAAPIAVGKHVVQVSLSIGIMLAPIAGLRAADILLDAADRGLYRAKADGKQRWVFQTPDG